MRVPLYCVLFSIVLVACADDDSQPSEPEPVMEPEPEPDTEAEVMALIVQVVEQYDRQFEAICTCFVASGGFASQEECLALFGSGDIWVECATEFVQQLDAGTQSFVDAQCMIDESSSRADCLEAAGCELEAMTPCIDMPRECPGLANEFLVELLEFCPDLGLLSRVSP